MIRSLLMCSLSLVVAGCTFEPVIPLQPLPAPAMEKLPVHVALVTDEAFRTYEFEGPLMPNLPDKQKVDSVRLHYKLGEMNVDLFSQVSTSLFAQITRFDSWEALKASGGSFDGVLVPSVAFFDAGGPPDYDSNTVFADVTYKVLFFDQHERQILDWKVVSHQLVCEDVTICHGYKIIMPLIERDIAAKILSQFPEFPEITGWVKSLESGR